MKRRLRESLEFQRSPLRMAVVHESRLPPGEFPESTRLSVAAPPDAWCPERGASSQTCVGVIRQPFHSRGADCSKSAAAVDCGDFRCLMFRARRPVQRLLESASVFLAKATTPETRRSFGPARMSEARHANLACGQQWHLS